jgi:hypothetical protein
MATKKKKATKAKRTTKKATKAAPKKAAKSNGKNTCLCGCGRNVKKQFVQGHDATLHSLVVQAVKAGKKLVASAGAKQYVKNRWPQHAKIVL